MRVFYSKSTGGFYHDQWHGAPEIPHPEKPDQTIPNPDTKIPSDAVEITEAAHIGLMNGQATGKKVIVSGPDGFPLLQDKKFPPPDKMWPHILPQIATSAAKAALAVAPESPLSDGAKTQWREYARALGALTVDYKNNPQDIVWPQEPR